MIGYLPGLATQQVSAVKSLGGLPTFRFGDSAGPVQKVGVFMAESPERIPHALTRAHSELVAALETGIEQFKAILKYSNSDDVRRCIERFVNELCRVPKWGSELEARKRLVSVRCQQGTAYRERMDQAFNCLRKAPSKKPLGPNLSSAKLALWGLKPVRSLHFESILTTIIDKIKHAEREGLIPIRCRKVFRLWLDECRQIANDARRVEADGCFYLSCVYHAGDSSATEMDRAAEAILMTNYGGANLESIKAAADSLLDWASRQAASEPAGANETGLRGPVWDTTTEARNKWLYEQCWKVVPYNTIKLQLKKKPKSWVRLCINGIKNAANAYAQRHELPPIPKRQSGAPRKKSRK